MKRRPTKLMIGTLIAIATLTGVAIQHVASATDLNAAAARSTLTGCPAMSRSTTSPRLHLAAPMRP